MADTPNKEDEAMNGVAPVSKINEFDVNEFMVNLGAEWNDTYEWTVTQEQAARIMESIKARENPLKEDLKVVPSNRLMPNTNVEDAELRAEIDEQLNILGESDDVSGVAKNLMQLIAARERKAVEEAELRGVKFAILIIDLLHIEDNDADNDKVYKHVKNTIRIRFEGKTGIDPAPNYPIEAREAELTSTKDKS